MTESEQIKWDLSIIFPNNDEAKAFIKKCESDLISIKETFQEIQKRENISSSELSDFLNNVNTVMENMSGVSSFAYNQSAQDQTVKESLALVNEVEGLYTKGGSLLTSIEIQLSKFLKKQPQLVQDEQLIDFKHY